MSDIEDYTYSPYDDDLEDILWDADPAPELADDLAEHAVHSPVYLDEVAGYELEDYFSDWEYYSDDYMDDDPVLLKRDPQVGVLKQGKDKNNKGKASSRGKKRKLEDALDNKPPHLDETKLLTQSIRGTVCADPAKREPPSYTEGQEGKVALMKNWKERFAITDDGWGRQSGQAGEDESWAKNMSLADMGLQNVQRQSSFERGTEEANGGMEGEEEGEDQDEGDFGDEDDVEVGEDRPSTAPRMNGASALTTTYSPDPAIEDSGGGRLFKRTPSKLSTEYVISSNDLEHPSEGELPTKRRRIQPDLPTPPNPKEPEIGKIGDSGSQTRRKLLPSSESNNLSVEDVLASGGSQVENSATPLVDGSSGLHETKKRKATDDLVVEEGGSSQSTAGGRSKRVTSNNSRATESIITTSRTTRNSKQK